MSGLYNYIKMNFNKYIIIYIFAKFKNMRLIRLMNLLVLFGLCSTSLIHAQIGVHGDVFIASNGAVGTLAPELHFFEGHIQTTDQNAGHINFAPNAHAFDAHNGSHAVAPVVSKSHTSFVFPVGDQGVYQPMMITEGSADELTVKFNLRAFPNTQPNRAIEQISNRFYWAVDGDKEALLSLTWNSFSELTFLTDELAALVMVGYNGTDWEVIPAIVDPFSLDGNSPTSLREGSIRSIDPVRFSRFEALSLGSVVLDTSLKVSEGLTPNGDNINDRWYIENIERYPDARIWVYSRWGAEVFHQAGNYTNNWDATYKNNTKKLPSAPYLYQIDQDNNGSIDLRGWIYITY